MAMSIGSCYDTLNRITRNFKFEKTDAALSVSDSVPIQSCRNSSSK